MAFLLFSCKTTNKLKEGEYLLDENIITNNKTEVPTDEITPFIRQQSNRYLVNINALGIKWFPYYLWMYNSIDKTKMVAAKAARDKKYDEINANRIIKNNIKNKKREAKGKKPKPLKLKDKTSLTWRETWVQNGEPPVILDSGLIKLGKDQIKKFLFTKGYFNAAVSDSVVVSKNKKKANVYYKLQAGIPYQINNIQYKVEDPTLEYFILQDTVHSLIKRGMRYDVDVLTKERDRISKQQRNDGYYKFGPEFIYLLIDTNVDGNKVNVEINVKKYAYHPENNSDTLVYINHLRYHINNIYIITDYDIFNRNKQYNDTAVYDDVTFLYTKKLLFRKKDIANKISFYKDELFNNDKVEETYSRLSSMKAFKSVNINFKQDEHKQDYINSYILMSPTYKQNFGVETDGTTTSGNLGVEASIVYQNKNIFRGSELLEIKLKGGLIAQKNFDAENTNTNSNINIPYLKAFNTVQFGPELNLNFPKPLFPFTLLKYSKNAAPKTILSSSFNFQQNSLYSRGLTSLSYGVQFNGKKYIKHIIVPFEANLIKAYLSQGFSDQLVRSGNLFLRTSFSSHMTTVSRYTFIYNNQLNTPASQYKTFSYFKADLESSGNLLRGVYNLTDQHKNGLGQYEILNVPFAQFLRADIDYRAYKSVRKLGRFVYRISGGMGYALQNLTSLPYEKSFYGGGPNDVRAWKARSLGPGGYNAISYNKAHPDKQDLYFDKIGDIQIEMNFEYRFNIYKWLNGAYFVDAGNIWLRQKQADKPLGEFDIHRFYKEFATGTGVGLRADFSFFILRIDAAFKVYNPGNDEGQRFMFGGGQFINSCVLNFGIGYPF